MADHVSDAQIEEALARCEEEQIHIPGLVQPFACLLGFHSKTLEIVYASENTHAILGQSHQNILSGMASDVFDSEVLHGVQNARARGDADKKSVFVGAFQIADKDCAVHVFESDQHVVMEVEPLQHTALSRSDGLKTFGFLVDNIEECASEQELFEQITRVLRHLSGYDRVMVYRFDESWNGQVLAEDRRSSMQSFVGLRFPHWDIPAQARTMMEKTPLRFIDNIDQEPVPLHAKSEKMPPLDLSLAYCRGVSIIHMEYLRNLGVAATMTLTVKVLGKLWGIISFHHMVPRVPTPNLRELLVQVGRMFSVKLHVLQQEHQLASVSRVDQLKDEVLEGQQSDGALDTFTETVLEILAADGLCITDGDREFVTGNIPDAPLLTRLKEQVSLEGEVLSFDRLVASFPDVAQATNGCAGAIVFSPSADRKLLVFRNEMTQDVTWAGNPEKTIEVVSGKARLSPRVSFSAFLGQVRGQSKPWSDQDKYFASRIWTLINTVERRELILKLNRQQKILIDELNHRVRNILSLVRSVSQQTRHSSHGSLEQYSRTLEARIQALAASHDLASSSVTTPVSVSEMILREFSPFTAEQQNRLHLTGESRAMRAEMAPIFSLVIHELVTNAVKYGALSKPQGQVAVTLTSKSDGGLAVEWRETGGPPVIHPETFGFGSTLIQQAVPYELDGDASLRFDANGVEADFYLPKALFDLSQRIDPAADNDQVLRKIENETEFLSMMGEASCLVVEDNFLIAKETKEKLLSFGVSDVEIVGNVTDALDHLNEKTPTFAVLDVDLGQEEISALVAERLQEAGIPFFFATGYGDQVHVEERFRGTLRVTKPVTPETLQSAIATVLGPEMPTVH